MFAPSDAEELAREYLAVQLPIRWERVQGVGRKARSVGGALGADAGLLEAAGWLHDIGYSPGLVDTGFHPLDGARFLREQGVDERLVCLVAHHTCALVEAGERGLADVLASEFECEESTTADLLWYCDLTVGPSGQALTVEGRLTEIHSRYGAGTYCLSLYQPSGATAPGSCWSCSEGPQLALRAGSS
jgi:hypothetical protein